MDLRGQDHKRIVMPSSFVYNSPIREQPTKASSIFSTAAGGGRRDGPSGNGSGILSPSQAFEHHHSHSHSHSHPHPHPHPLQLQQNQQSPPTQTQTQTPSQPPPPQQQQQQVAPTPTPLAAQQLNQGRVSDPEQEQEQDSEPDPDPIPVSIAVAGVQIGGGSATTRTPTTRIEVPSIRYRECLKNHAASIGGHVVDGCGEFMPGGEEGTPEALKCAACECHRNFHRKESDGEPQSGANYYYCYNPSSKANGSRSRILPPSLPPPPIPQPIQQHQKYPIGLPTSPPSGHMAPVMMAFGGGGGGAGSAATDSSSEEHNVFQTNAGAGPTSYAPQYGSLSKKRFRTKFSKEQKDKMLEFADKVGWRMQKQDEPAVQQFCAEVGVKRQVLKVWMHNNKHSMKKKEL